jgi:DNA sulfur modification protein DndB
MKIPVIRASMGIWNYYLATLSFSQIASYVKMLNSELHEIGVFEKRENITQLKEYLLSQDERLLNSLVLAVSEGEPKWIEVELHYQDEDFFNLGFLEFTGEEKIFPIHGQAQVEAIKAAVKENPKLSNEKVPVIFIGHKNTTEGIQRSQRLFSYLNRQMAPSVSRPTHSTHH